MHQKEIDLSLREETPHSLLFSDSKNTTASPSFLHQKVPHFQTESQSTPITTPNHHHNHPHYHPNHHLQIEIPPFSTSPRPSPVPTLEPHLQNEHFAQNQPKNFTTSASTPRKRPMMSQSPNLSPSSNVPTFHHHHKKNTSFICSSSLQVLLATRRITLKFIHHSCHPTWLRVHLKLFMLICLPSFYLFSSTHHWPLALHFVCVVIFSAFVIISCNLALPRLPSIRLFLARTLCITKFPLPNSGSKDHPPVVWSIGSKRKPERRPNSGSWVQVYSNKDVYEGEFHKGKCSGSGVYYYHMSGRYEGDWIDEKYDGYGVETWAKGSRYRGQYRQGLRHGVGVYKSYTGDVYAGEWCNGQCHGCGVHTCADGSCYVGEFKWGVKHGLGHYHFRNGDRYAGEYFADKMHGFGVYIFGNGHQYEGAWHEGRRQGLGIYTFRNGETQSGHWQNGVLNRSSTQCILPGSPSMVDHLKVLTAVQEAQRAAEKAVNVAKVDERVNRAVAAANRAATAARVAAVKAVQNQMMHQNHNDFSIPIPVV